MHKCVFHYVCLYVSCVVSRYIEYEYGDWWIYFDLFTLCMTFFFFFAENPPGQMLFLQCLVGCL